MTESNKTVRVAVQLMLDRNSSRQLPVEVKRLLQQSAVQTPNAGARGGIMGMLANPRDSMRDFGREFTTAMRTAASDVQKLDQALANVGQRLKGIGQTSKGFMDFEAMMGSGQQRPPWMAAPTGVPPPPGEAPPGGHGAGGGRGGGHGPLMGRLPSGFEPPAAEDERRSHKDRVLMGLTISRALAGALQMGGGIAQGMKTAEIGNFAAATNATRRALADDLSTGVSKYVMIGKEQSVLNTTGGMFGGSMGTVGNTLMDRGGGQTAHQVGLIGQTAGGLLDTAMSLGRRGGANGGGALGGVAGGLGQATQGFIGLTHGGAEAAEAQAIKATLDAEIMARPLHDMAGDMMRGEKHMRAAAARKLGNREMKAAGVGACHMFGRGESFGIAESMQRLTGMDQMFSGGLLNSAMTMRQSGIEGGDQALASVFGAFGGDKNPNSGRQSMVAIELAVAKGATRGFTDIRVKEELISAIAVGSQSATLKDNEGINTLIGILTGGATGKVGVAEAQARRGALGHMDAIMQNPFFQGAGLANAKGILGSDAKSASMMTLGAATTSELAIGGEQFDRLGISAQQRRAQILRMARADVAATAPGMGFGNDVNGLMKDEGSLASMFFLTNGRNDRQAKAQASMVASLEGLGTDASDDDIKSVFAKFGGSGGAAVAREEQFKFALEQFTNKYTMTSDELKKAIDRLVEVEGTQKDQTKDGQSAGSALFVEVVNGGKPSGGTPITPAPPTAYGSPAATATATQEAIDIIRSNQDPADQWRTTRSGRR